MSKVYVVTPTMSSRWLETYFKTLDEQDNRDFRVVLVDNSCDCSITAPEGVIHIENKENNFFAESMNQGIRKAFEDPECKYIIALNDDVKLKKDFITQLVNCAERHPKAGSIQSLMWFGDTGTVDSTGLEISKNGLGFNREGYIAEPCYSEVEIFGCCAGACLYTRKALEKSGLFDEDFKLYFEDFDLAFRLRNEGFKAFFCPKAVMWHYKTISYNKIKNYFWSRNYTINFCKNMPHSFESVSLLLLTECVMLGMNLVKGRFEIMRAKWDAYIYILTKLERQSLNKNTEKFFVMKWRAK